MPRRIAPAGDDRRRGRYAGSSLADAPAQRAQLVLERVRFDVGQRQERRADAPPGWIVPAIGDQVLHHRDHRPPLENFAHGDQLTLLLLDVLGTRLEVVVELADLAGVDVAGRADAAG